MDELNLFRKNAMIGAMGAPLCEEYRALWAAADGDKEKLVALSLRQQAIPYVATYCANNLGVSKQYILSNFDKYINGRTFKDVEGVAGYTYALYVGISGDFLADCDVTHTMWCDGLRANIPETKAVHIYASNGSKVNVVCDGFNTIKLSIFDNSTVEIEDADPFTNITAYLYSTNASINAGKFCNAKIKTTHKQIEI